MIDIIKGSRIYAEWFEVYPASLSGAQMKMGATQMQLTGTVQHIRSDGSSIRFFVDADENSFLFKAVDIGCGCGYPHIELRSEWVKKVL